MTLTGKTAVVTGGSRGIGRAIVRRLARDGATVVFGYKENTAAADELTGELDGVVAVRADLDDPASVEALFEPVGGELDILVNNAAINPQAAIADITAAEFERVLRVNTMVPVLAMGHAASSLRAGGRIVNISTLNTVVPVPGNSLYSASKAALEQFTAIAAREFGERGITVNTVSPGATDTEMLRASVPADGLAQNVAFTALRRLGRPEDIANVVAFLVGPDAGWVTGQNIRATGGLIV